MAYLYRHIRLDINEVFYIGIGSDEKEYKRAYNKKGRSYSWKDIAYNFPYEVEIMLDNLTWKEACIKEIEFISIYGRKNLSKGPLINLTDGGEGQLGRKDSQETREKKSKPKSLKAKINMKESHNNRDYSYLKGKAGVKKGTIFSNEHKLKLSLKKDSTKLKIFCPELNKTFNSLTEASKFLNKSTGNISNILKSKSPKTRNGLTLIRI